MPRLPASLIEPVWVQFCHLLGGSDRPEFQPGHPWGCHRRRVPDGVVFDCVIAALVHGSGYERVAVPGRADRTIRRRLHEWAASGPTEQLLRDALAAFETMIGLQLGDITVDGCITNAPCGRELRHSTAVGRGRLS